MGDKTFSREMYRSAVRAHVPLKGPATKKAEQEAHDTGRLNPLVDPAGFGVIRRSLPRLKKKGGNWVLTVGTPMPIETRVDTTGSMGGNVDVALQVLPEAFESFSQVLLGYDLQIATGIFGDVGDEFVLCRPQFEMEAGKIVEQLTLMVPERKGGDRPEDPHYGLFGAAYLTATHISRIGLKGYDFTVSDAPARSQVDIRQLQRIFSDEVLAKVAENGYQLNDGDLPTTTDIVQDLLKIAHAFFLQVGGDSDTSEFWTEVFGQERVVMLPMTELLPQVQAVIIGLTEGTFGLTQVEKFLQQHNVELSDAQKIARAVANIPIGAQAALPNFGKRPQKGDVFKDKASLWPIGQEESAPSGDSSEEKTGWF